MGPDIQTSRFKETCCQNLAEYFQENCLSTCCGKGQRNRAFAKARDELNRETSIIELIRQQRFIMSAVKELMPKGRVETLQQKSQFLIVEEDYDEQEPLVSNVIFPDDTQQAEQTHLMDSKPAAQPQSSAPQMQQFSVREVSQDFSYDHGRPRGSAGGVTREVTFQ